MRDKPYLELKPHIRKWWDIANDRRQRLILKKHKGGGLTDQQQREYDLLQAIGERLVDAVSPPLKFLR